MSEILLLALVAFFIIHKLFTILGRVDPEEDIQRIKRKFSTTQSGYQGYYNNSSPHTQNINAEIISDEELSLPSEMQKQIQEIRYLEPEFQLNRFLQGATRAFQMIKIAIEQKDTETLAALCSNQIYNKYRSEEQKNLKTTIMNDIKPELKLSSIAISGKLINISLEIKYQEPISIHHNSYNKDSNQDENQNINEATEKMNEATERTKNLANFIKEDKFAENFKKNVTKNEIWTFTKHTSSANMWKVTDILQIQNAEL